MSSHVFMLCLLLLLAYLHRTDSQRIPTLNSLTNNTALLVCRLNSVHRPPTPHSLHENAFTFIWKKNEQKIRNKSTEGFSIQSHLNTSSLLIRPDTLPLGSFMFTCLVKLRGKTLQTNYYSLNLLDPFAIGETQPPAIPYITASLSHTTTILTCHPKSPNIRWFKDYLPAESFGLSTLSDATLSLSRDSISKNTLLHCSLDKQSISVLSEDFMFPPDGKSLSKDEADYTNDAPGFLENSSIRIAALETLNSTAISISWTHDFTEHVLGFRICLNPGSVHYTQHSNTDCLITQNVSNSQLFKVVSNLQKATLYSVVVSSYFANGVLHSKARTVQTEEDVPSQPTKVTLRALNSTSVALQWQPPEHYNGVIRGYKVYYTEHVSQNDSLVNPLIYNLPSDNSTEAVINGMQAGKEYFLQVAAFTKEGDGERSKTKRIKLPASVLLAPTNFKAAILKEDRPGVVLTWNHPPTLSDISQFKIVYYPAEQPNLFKQEFINGDQSRVVIRYLDRGMDYIFKISALAAGDWSDEATLVAQTAEGAPIGSPMNISVHDVKANSAKLVWSPPMLKFRNGKITLYEVRELSDTSIEDWATNTTDLYWFLTDLEPQKPYSHQVRAYTAIGAGPWSSSVFFVTAAEIPVNPPRNIKLLRVSPTELQVSWNPVFIREPVLYQVFYTIHSVSDISEWQKAETSISSIILKGLQTNSYVVRVQTKVPSLAKTSELSKRIAETPSLIAPMANPSFHELSTPKPIGDRVRNISIKVLNDSLDEDKQAILLEWQHPEKIGIKHYQVLYEGSKSYIDEQDEEQQLSYKQEKRVERTSKNARVEDLLANTFYKFQITSCFMDLVCSTSLPVSHKTRISKPPEFEAPLIESSMSDKNKVILNLQKASGINGQILKYHLVLIPSKLYELRKPEDFTNEELLNYSQTNERLTKSPSLFVVGIYSELPKIVAFVRDEEFVENSNTIHILHPDQNYKTFIRAFTSEKHFTSSYYSQVIRISSRYYPKPLQITKENSNQTLIMFILIPSFTFFILLVLIPILVTYSMRKKRNKKKSFSRNQYVSMVAPDHCTPVNFIKDDYNENCKSSTSKPRSIHHFSKVMEELRQNDCEGMRSEYESIDPGQQFTWEVSNKEENKSKNRFANVVAYDHSRVLLGKNESFLLNGTRGSIAGSVHTNVSFNKSFESTCDDYINANYIDGYCRTKAYIATQGPMMNTINDFWQMVWEQKASMIIMLTNFEERGKVKCDQYWSSTSTELYGGIYVSLSEVNNFSTYTTRTFQLTNVSTMEKRVLMQFHYTDWPDQGVPSCSSSLLLFIKRTKAFVPVFSGPAVVHCSAGVGRTGVFIAIDISLDRTQYEEMVDVFGCVTLMRSQRNYMVQTEEQYRLVYEVLEEAIENGKTSIPADRLFGHFISLMEVNPVSNLSDLEIEFKKLNSYQITFSYKTMGHKNKNRSQDILPNESSRVHLSSIHEVSASDYINANFVNSYKDRRAFIATQAPMASTCEDFWRMVWECKCAIVVAICKLKEAGKDMCFQYWPEGRSVRYKYFVVDPIAQYNMPFYTLREFKVTDARDGQSRVLRQFQYSEWPETGVPSSGEGFIEFIGHIQKTKQQFGIESPIVVHCNLGAGRTGVFIALNNCIERLGYEGIVDIYQVVKLMRLQRSCLIQTLDEYCFCYQAALDYLGSFDNITS